MNEQAKVFLTKMKERILDGAYDEYVGLFVSRELIYASMKARVLKKVETGATPLLGEAEIKDALEDTKEIAALTALLFTHNKVINKTEDGYVLSKHIKF